VRQASITILLNYSILLLDKPDPEGKIQIVSALSGGVLLKETDAQSYLRLVTALANVAYQDSDAKEAVVAMTADDIKGSKAPETMEGNDEKTNSLIKEIKKIILS
jgi:hypothetical protein